MNFFKSLIVLFTIAMVSACGSDNKSSTDTTTTTETTTTTSEWDLDTPADGKLLFQATTITKVESAKLILKSVDAQFVNAMMGTLENDVTKNLKLTTQVKIYNLDYDENGTVIAELDCPEEVQIDLGTVQYSKLPYLIDLSVKGQNNTITFSCSDPNGDKSFYVTIYKDADPNIDNGYEFKLDVQQRSFIGRMYIKDKSESNAYYGKTLFF